MTAPRYLAALAALVLVAAAGPSAAPLLLREQGWTQSSPRLAYDLTHAPGECLAERNPEIEIGRALFRAPALIGGPAARAGLSCNACHSNGGMNTRFLFPELTDRPGHADVTSEWASHVRGDGRMNAIPIPDLAGASGKSGFGQGQVPTLSTFTRSVITEEFQGAPPPDAAFEGVLAYMRALRLRACPSSDVPITLATAADDVRRAVAAARSTDGATSRLVLLAAQDAMGRIVERLPEPAFTRDRVALELLARDLAAVRDVGDTPAALEELAPAWSARFDAAIARIARHERRTYFNEATLQRALEQ